MTNEQVRQQLMELKLKDLTPDAFDLLFNFAFAKVVIEGVLTTKDLPKVEKQTKKIVQKKPATKKPSKKAQTFDEALNVFRNGEKPPTKNARALKILGETPTGLKATELAERLEDEVRLIYPLLSNLKREGKVVAKDGTYFAVRSNGE